MKIDREGEAEKITIGTPVDESTAIDLARFGGGSFHLPTTSGTTEITVYAQVGSVDYGIANNEDWTPLPAKAVTAGLPYPLPSVSYNYQRLKLVATGGDATADVPVFMKG